MSSRKRMAALVIGVSDASPLDYIPGAVNSARAFHQWAKALGYDAQLITDDKRPVTIARLRRELEKLLAGDSRIHRFVIYFAGHGLIREAEQGLWLLSDWSRELRAVNVEGLRRRLGYYGVKQVAIFADACRSLPPDLDTADLTADSVLGRGPEPRLTVMPVDKFVAAQDGTKTFMIPGPNPEDDRCLFSGVLLEALWGTKSAAFSRLLRTKVTSRSLGAYLESEVPRVAASYRYDVVPMVSPTFPEDDDVYFGHPPDVTAPKLPDWPPLRAVTLQSAARARESAQGTARASRTLRARRAETSAKALEKKLRDQQRPNSFETGAGFAVDGEKVIAVWTRPDAIAGVSYRPDWWHVGVRSGRSDIRLKDPAPVLIELASGRFAAVTALPSFVGSLVVKPAGVSGLVYREIHSQPTVAALTESALGEMERGALRADAAADLAIQLRQSKHVDPITGVISAYLYDSIGDVDNIRRMAFYYVRRRQPIPYDIAFLAQLRGQRRGQGPLRATVPAVPQRRPRTKAEQRHAWTRTATPRAIGVVGGFWPWLKQGWALLDDPAPNGSTLVLPGLIELADRLAPARFPTLDSAAGRQLAALFNLSPRPAGIPQ
jgi:Caspase domain